MVRNRDEMTFTPTLESSKNQTNPRRRAQEERKTDRVRKRRSSIVQRIKRIRAVRRLQSLSKRAGKAKNAIRNPFKTGAKGAGSAGGIRKAARGAGRVVGIVAIVLEAIIVGGRAARAVSGKSGRLIDAEDADTMLGALDEQATAAAEARGFIESRPNLLRVIAQQGKVNSQIVAIAAEQERISLIRARGADLIARDPDFDSPDTLIAKIIAKSQEANLKGLADEAAEAIRSTTGQGRMTTAR